ncbi:hypothetical protein, partial [Pseudomonas syringae]
YTQKPRIFGAFAFLRFEQRQVFRCWRYAGLSACLRRQQVQPDDARLDLPEAPNFLTDQSFLSRLLQSYQSLIVFLLSLKKIPRYSPMPVGTFLR